MAIIKCPKCGEEYDTLYSSHSCKNESEKLLGFGWGNFWIIANLIFNILSILFVGGIYLLTIFSKPENFTGAIIISLVLIFLFEGFFIAMVIGLLKRKIWGLYLTYICLFLGIFGIVMQAIEKNFFYLLLLGILYLWFKYFYRRRNWFK